MTGTASLPLLFVDHGFPDEYRDLVDGRAVVVGSGTDDDLDRADAILAGATRLWNASEFAKAPACTVISRVGVGYDNVVVADAAAAGITVCNTPWAPAVSTAEHTIALMMAVTKHLHRHTARAREGLAGEGVGFTLELDGRTLGLVGCGRIATRVAVTALALGMRVLATDPVLTEPPIDGVRLVDLPTLLAESDVVSLHAPALPSTRHLMNADAFATMRRGSYLVNCARGVLVDHDALLDAIDRGHLAGAGLDVTEPEPLPAGHPLLDRENVVVTPHIASATVAGRRRLYEHSIDNALAILDGRPADTVTPPTA
jgi:phosphoglycerate dehydrogenase-like enzyme